MMSISLPEAKKRVINEVNSWYIDIVKDTIADIECYRNIKTPEQLKETMSTLHLNGIHMMYVEKEYKRLMDYIDGCENIYDLLSICHNEDKFGLFFDHEETILATILGIDKISIKYH